MKKIDLIEIVNGKEQWQDAIKRGVNLLVKNGIATSDLADSIIESTNQLGPYYVLMPKVALAHTRPGDYNKKIGISLVIYKEPIRFSDNDKHEVKLLFVLSALDDSSHIDLLQNFATVMGAPNIVDKILSAKTKKDIYQKIKEFL